MAVNEKKRNFATSFFIIVLTMKQFFKMLLATICGIIIVNVIGMIFLFTMIGGLMSSSVKTVKAEPGSVFVLKLNGMVNERYEDAGPLASIIAQGDLHSMGLDDILAAIKRARDNENIEGIYIEGGATTFDSPATAQQIRNALKAFKESGKWVVAYADQYLQASYYVCSVADQIYLNSTGMIDFRGLGGKNFYMKGLYDKLGIEYQAARVGKYKSYVETLTRTDMSADDREQRTAYLQGIWQQWLAEMAESRGVEAAALDQLANDSIMMFADANDYVAAKLVDGLMYPDNVKALICGKLGLTDDATINQLSLDDMTNLKTKKDRKADRVAVYYAYGEIIDEMASGFASEHAIVGNKTVEDLNELAKDDKVKAVVLRVNSGGGSAVASEQIWHAVNNLREKKPVVVSMGGVAASGGYMISCGADYIYAEPTTITGSIGIFGLVPNVSRLLTDKLGITLDGVTTNRHGDVEINLIFGKDNKAELQALQGYTDRGYENFLTIVGMGRDMEKDSVHQIAQGRVWLATDALEHHLVDGLGSLDDAIVKAAQLAGTDNFSVAAYPAKTDWLSQLLAEEKPQHSYIDGQMRQLLGELYEPIMDLRKDELRNRLQARLPFNVSVK